MSEVLDAILEVERLISTLPSVIVAFSGGVDSSLVAALAFRAIGHRATAITAVSAALATGELDGARSVAAAIGITHEIVHTDEMQRQGYRDNGPDRCYHCKSELYDTLDEIARAQTVNGRTASLLLSGANVDDLGEWRPGLRAAAEHNVRHPLVEANIGKAMVRAMAEHLQIPNAQKPASPCLASRVPHGTPVDAVTLALIDKAEMAVKALGYGVLRVRHLGDLGRVELSERDLQEAADPSQRERIVAAVLAAGYQRVEIDPVPFRSGSLTIQFLPTRR
jgi:pyridinium-3,5-biscarboxylic acid mononucleotide sulfurtransferase